jgi:hypothetical protein
MLVATRKRKKGKECGGPTLFCSLYHRTHDDMSRKRPMMLKGELENNSRNLRDLVSKKKLA